MQTKLSQYDQESVIIRDCILKYGVSVETRVIAQELGVTEAELFRNHGTKTVLLAKALGYDQLLPIMNEVESGPTDEPLAEQLTRIAMSLIPYFMESLPSTMALWSASSAMNADGKSSARDPRDVNPAVWGRNALAAWFTRAQEQGRLRFFDTQAASVMFQGCCEAPATRFHIGEDLIDIERYTHHFVPLFLNGLLVEKEPTPIIS
jgi:hypothetical protein